MMKILKFIGVDSGQVIGENEKIKLRVDGSINFCPYKNGKNPVKVLVPAVFCTDDSIPKFDKDGKEMHCEKKGFIQSSKYGNSISQKRYVDTNVKVNSGDRLIFSLVPKKIKMDCDKLENISLDSNCYRTKVVNEENRATKSEICKGGTFFFKSNDNKIQEIKFQSLGVDEKETKRKHEVLVGNGYTPYDNKVIFDINKEKDSWSIGSLLDLRRNKVGLNDLCATGGKNHCSDDEKKNYPPYELNCYLQNICYNKKGIADQFGKPCTSSIRYKKYDVDNKCNMYSYLKKINDNLNEGSFTQTHEDNISWAEALVAKIGDDNGINTAKGDQCFPQDKGPKYDGVCSKVGENFDEFSLKLNHEYVVGSSNNLGHHSSVMLAIASEGNYHLHRGGYNVKVSRLCDFNEGKKLYVYLGDSPPQDTSKSGENGNFLEVRNLEKGEDPEYYVINGSTLKETKKIYFGIDVKDVTKDELIDNADTYYKDNKYTVNLFINKKINDFISSNVNRVFAYIKDDSKNTVRQSYEGYRRGFLQAVRALLTLYVIFSVVGYMLGTLQLSKYDFIVRIVKIAFIAFVFSDKSWELLGTQLSKFFIDGSNYLVNSFSGYIGSESNNFTFLDFTAGVLFTGETWLKFLSLIFSGPFGLIAFLMIGRSTFVFLRCIISALMRYIIAIVLGGFLLSLTPLFIVFILFQKTKPLFDNWIKALAHMSIQPVILFSSLSLLNQLMYSILYNLTNFSACYQCLISINFLESDFCIMKSMLPIGYNPSMNVDDALSNGTRVGGYFAALPIDLIQAFMYLIVASAMETFVVASENIAHAIFQSGYGVVGSVGAVANTASQALLSTVGLDRGTQSMIQRVKEMSQKHPNAIEVTNKPSSQNNQGDSQSDTTKNQNTSGEIVQGEKRASEVITEFNGGSKKTNEEN